MKNEKQSLRIFLDENGEPKAIIFFNKNRDRVIYVLSKADEDQIVDLLENKNKNV